LPDKGANLERLGKNLKLFTDKKEVELTQPITVVVRSLAKMEIILPNNWEPRPDQMHLWSYLESGGRRAVE
jgi:hypothetical protein